MIKKMKICWRRLGDGVRNVENSCTRCSSSHQRSVCYITSLTSRRIFTRSLFISLHNTLVNDAKCSISHHWQGCSVFCTLAENSCLKRNHPRTRGLISKQQHPLLSERLTAWNHWMTERLTLESGSRLLRMLILPRRSTVYVIVIPY